MTTRSPVLPTRLTYVLRRLRRLGAAFLHPVVPAERAATAAADARLPDSVRGPDQVLGTSTAGCSATHGVHEACSFSCTACYLPESAQAAPPMPHHEVAAQLDAIAQHVGPWGHVQITSGEVTLLPVEQLVDILRSCSDAALTPMLMTHGQVLLDDPMYLERLVREGGLSSLALHVDTTQRGRPGWHATQREPELRALRERLFGLVGEVRRRTGKPVKAAHTVTVTPESLADLPEVVDFALRCDDLFLLSLQPVAEVGRTQDAAVTGRSADVWDRVCAGVGRRLNPHAWVFGHPACNTVSTLLVVKRDGEPHVVELTREGARVDRWFWRRVLQGGLAGWTPNDRTRGEAVARLLGRLVRRPRLLLDIAFYTLYRAWTERALLFGVLGTVLRLRPVSVRGLNLVVHHFMSEDQLDTPEGRERLAACSFFVPVEGEMVSMCEFNGSGQRRALDDAAARSAGRTPRPARRATATVLKALMFVALSMLPGCFSLVVSPATVDPASLAAMDHFDDADWRTVLETRVDGEGRVDYTGLAADPAPLERYVALLAEVGPSTRPELFPDAHHRLAYWINAYNALVLFNVLQHPELESVGDAKAGFFYLTCFRLDGAEINLYDLENSVVRERFDEPRSHFALNCASVGCPRLPAEPFEGARLEQQLARETARFLSEPRNVAVEEGQLVLSEIFDWYAEDFPPSPADWVVAHRGGAPLGSWTSVRYRPYDWALNAQPGRATR